MTVINKYFSLIGGKFVYTDKYFSLRGGKFLRSDPTTAKWGHIEFIAVTAGVLSNSDFNALMIFLRGKLRKDLYLNTSLYFENPVDLIQVHPGQILFSVCNIKFNEAVTPKLNLDFSSLNLGFQILVANNHLMPLSILDVYKFIGVGEYNQGLYYKKVENGVYTYKGVYTAISTQASQVVFYVETQKEIILGGKDNGDIDVKGFIFPIATLNK